MDNLIFKGKTKEELRKNTLEGLEIVAKHDLYIKESKCYWEVKEVPVLGHIVGKGRLQMEATKVKTILERETPKNWKDVQKFNGFCNFYRRYVRGYSKVARPITQLMGNCYDTWSQYFPQSVMVREMKATERHLSSCNWDKTPPKA